jgi:hypothetical protein
MPGSCPYVNTRGRPCGGGFAAGFTHCAHHREKTAPKPTQPCTSCGKPTKRPAGICLGRACGWNLYRRELLQRKKAAGLAPRVLTAEELVALANAEEARRTEALFDELADALAGLKPWPIWVGQSREDFEAEGGRAAASQAAELEAFTAIKADEERQRQAAAADLLAAIEAAEIETAAAAERQRDAAERQRDAAERQRDATERQRVAAAQLERLRGIYGAIAVSPRTGAEHATAR